MRKRRRFNSMQVVSFVFAAMLIFTFIISLVIVPGVTDPNTAIDDVDIIPSPRPTTLSFPTPEAGGPQLALGESVMQANGLFQIAVPEDWTVVNNQWLPQEARARISFNSSSRLSVIDALVDTGVNFPNAQALADDYLTTDYFMQEWFSYSSATESARRVSDERIVIDFDLTANTLSYLGRQISWLEGDWLHSLRLVVPDNYPALLDALEAQVLPTFISYPQQIAQPFSWVAYHDAEQGYLLRTPGWQTVSPGVLREPSLPAQLRIRVLPQSSLNALDAAGQLLTERLHPSAQVLSSQVTERSNSSGYLVSYADRDSDGNPVSGLVTLLNGEDEQLYVADIEVAVPDIDLLALEPDSPYATLRQISDSFRILPAEAVQPVAGAEATAEAVDEQADSTPESTADPAPQATTEATAEAD